MIPAMGLTVVQDVLGVETPLLGNTEVVVGHANARPIPVSPEVPDSQEDVYDTALAIDGGVGTGT